MRVLLVEDDRSTRRFIKIILEKLGYETTECENAEDGWEAYQKEFHSMAILDWMLPGMSGVELCRQIRAMPQSEKTVIIMSTSQAELSDVEIALKAGADDYIVKPVDITQMKIRLFIAKQRIGARQDQLQVISALKNKLKAAEAKQQPKTEIVQNGTAAVIQPWQGILVAPFSGTVESGQIKALREQLFKKIEKARARFAIIDVDGVPTMDGAAALELMNTLKTLRLIGVQALMVGINGNVAQAILETGYDLNHITAFKTLPEGLNAALRKMAYRVKKNSTH